MSFNSLPWSARSCSGPSLTFAQTVRVFSLRSLCLGCSYPFYIGHVGREAHPRYLRRWKGIGEEGAVASSLLFRYIPFSPVFSGCGEMEEGMEAWPVFPSRFVPIGCYELGLFFFSSPSLPFVFCCFLFAPSFECES